MTTQLRTREAQGQIQARRAERSTPVRALARLGIVARAAVYIVIGVLALLVAMGRTGHETDRRGAIEVIAGEPFGRAIILVLAMGFAGHGLWRLLDSVGGQVEERDRRRRVLGRLQSLAVGVLYVGLAVSSVTVILGSGGGQGEQGWTARLLAMPFGRALVGFAGVVVLGVAVGIVWWTAARHYEEGLERERMGPGMRRLSETLGAGGHGARALVAALVGIFILRAAVTYDPHQARGLDGALKSLAVSGAGRALILVTAAGLLVHGVFSLLEARYRRI